MGSVIIGEDEKDVGLPGQRPSCGDKKKKDKTLHFFFAKAKLAKNRKTQKTRFMDKSLQLQNSLEMLKPITRGEPTIPGVVGKLFTREV